MVKYVIVIVFLCLASITDFYPYYRKVVHFVLWCLLSIIAGLRMAGGIDYGAYLEHYSNPEYGYWESGYVLLEKAGRLAGLDYHTFQFIITAFSLYVLFWFVRKHSNYPILSISFYLGTYFLFYNMVLNRQMIACSFALIAFDALLENRTKRFFCALFAGFCFHISIVILLLFYFFFYYISLTKWTFFLFVVVTIFLYYFPLGEFLAQNVGFRILGKGVGYFENSDYQANVFEYIKIAFFLCLIFTFRKFWGVKEVKFCIIAFLCFSCLLVSFSKFEILVRMSMYFDLLTMILLPLLLANFKRKSVLIIYPMLVIIFSSFFFYRLLHFEGGEFLMNGLYFFNDIF